MGSRAGIETDVWLDQGGIVVTASERAARAQTAAFHRRRRSEGLAAWTAPKIVEWKRFVRGAWEERSRDGNLLLNPIQEQSVWADLAAADSRLVTLLEGPRHRVADLAMGAHELLCAYAPRYLRPVTRGAWQNDAGAFSRWLDGFETTCRRDQLVSPARLPMKLLPLLEEDTAGQSTRPPLLLIGFDRIQPVQKALLDAWGDWQLLAPADRASPIYFHEAADDRHELAACARWAAQRVQAYPGAQLLVVTQDAAKRRGEIERTFLRSLSPVEFEFSLGVPLSKLTLPRTGMMLLRWMLGTIPEQELDWLFSTGRAAADAGENAALQAAMRELRRRGMERPSWALESFTAACGLSGGINATESAVGRPSNRQPDSLLWAWALRMLEARRQLTNSSSPRTPVEWAEVFPSALAAAGWPGINGLASAEFQAASRWRQAVDTCGSLGFNGRRMSSSDFLAALERATEGMLFAVESANAPVLIAGPAESAGLQADGVWFLGTDENSWPQGGAMHPLLPMEVQRETGMPHATAQLDWDVAQAATERLITSSGEVHFSYARQVKGTESRPSRLVVQMTGAAQALNNEFIAEPAIEVQTTLFEDSTSVPFARREVAGGSAVMTAQSNCSFKAFATARLAAQGWENAQPALTPAQRGQLLHAVMHRIWAGGPNGIRTSGELERIPDRPAWVFGHVQRVFQDQLPVWLRERMPARYLMLEQARLARLIAAWLDFEATRAPFEVVQTEARQNVEVDGLLFQLRLDRLDRLNDGSVLVVDYKTGDVKPKMWELRRPEDVQLPLYAGFALHEGQELGGLVFAKLRPGCMEFSGCVGAPAATLLPTLKNNTALMKNCLTAEQVMGWRDHIEKLVQAFLAGHADVDPRDPPNTCARCGLQVLCRVQEGLVAVGIDMDAEGSDTEAGNE